MWNNLEQFENNENIYLKSNDAWYFYWKNIEEESFILDTEEYKALNLIRKNHIEDWNLHFENIKPYFMKDIKTIWNINFENEFYCIWGWTSLALMWVINRNSEDIDIFCYEENLISIKNKFEKAFWVWFKRNDFNWAYYHKFPIWDGNEYKIEIVPFTEKIDTIKKDNFVFMTVEQTLRNKFRAVMEREEKRDIYDLAVLYFKRYDLFNLYINEKIAKRIYWNKNTIYNNEALLRVLKNKEEDFIILWNFFNYLEKRYHLSDIII